MQRSSISFLVASFVISGGLAACTVDSEEVGEAENAITGAPDPVLAWNDTASRLIVGPGGAAKPPPLALIDLAMVHTAIYDAVNSIGGYPYRVYATKTQHHGNASSYSATAAAARDVLVALYPSRQADIDAAYATSLAFVPDGKSKDRGIDVGQQAAAGILALRANDGRTNVSGYTPPSGTGYWQPTPAGFLPAQAPWVRNVTPWTLSSPSAIRPGPPPSLDSDLWINNYNETKALGAAVGSSRTPAQTDIGKFWGDNPMLQWVRAWRGLATAQGLSLDDNARLFAMLATGGSDGLIACWDAKFNYAFWRPVTAIRAGGGNPALTADPTWSSSVVTPNHPEYPAAHGCFSGAVTGIFTSFFGTDSMAFTINSNFPGVVQPVRSYASFSQAIDEVEVARIYGGMHYRNSSEVGSSMGAQVADSVTDRFGANDDDD